MKSKYNLLVLLLSLIFVSSCKTEDAITPNPTLVGKWISTDISYKITAVDPNTGKSTDKVQDKALATDATYEFKDDKTFTGSVNLSLNPADSSQARPISGTYALTGTELKLNYKSIGNDFFAYYSVNLAASTMGLSINKDLYIKGLTESKYPKVAAVASGITVLDFRVNFKKM